MALACRTKNRNVDYKKKGNLNFDCHLHSDGSAIGRHELVKMRKVACLSGGFGLVVGMGYMERRRLWKSLPADVEKRPPLMKKEEEDCTFLGSSGGRPYPCTCDKEDSQSLMDCAEHGIAQGMSSY